MSISGIGTGYPEWRQTGKTQRNASGTHNVKRSYGTYESENYRIMPDNELKEALQSTMGVDGLEREELQGYTLKTRSGTGIQYLIRDGEEGRGGI